MMRRFHWLLWIAIAIMLVTAGCEPALFPDRQQRTPFERYQLLHGEYRKKTQTSEFGAEEPALRDRLRPLDQHY